MGYTDGEKKLLDSVNEIGLKMRLPADENIIFAVLSPYLDQLMTLLKGMNPDDITRLFVHYEGVMKVMRMIEDSAKQMEKELGLA